MKMFGESSSSIKLGICILIYFQTLFVLSFSHRIKTRSSSSSAAGTLHLQNHPSSSSSFGSDDGSVDELQESLQMDTLDSLLSNPDNLPVPLPLSDLLLQSPQQVKNTFHLVDECVKITLDEGVYHFKSRGGSDQVCGLYFVSDPDKAIIIHVDYINVKCEDKGLISIVDGWELNGEVFPSPQDHEKETSARFTDICVDSSSSSSSTSTRRKEESPQRIFTSSQNAALVQYRVPSYGQGFSIRVRHVQNPTPCNILVQDLEAIYKLENFGRRTNCSLTTLFDAKIRVLYMSAGETRTRNGGTMSQVKYPSHRRAVVSSTFYHKCEKLGLEDYIQIGGSSGLDSAKMELIDEFCGHQNHPRGGYTTVFCGMTTLRLVSSGKFHNKIVAEVRRADIEDLESANFICDLM